MAGEDDVFAALADPTRRALLDSLRARNGQTLLELSQGFDMSRQAVSKHLSVLERAGLVVALARGREKHHFLNPAPLADIARRWISPYERCLVAALAELKHQLEEERHDIRGAELRLRDDDRDKPGAALGGPDVR